MPVTFAITLSPVALDRSGRRRRPSCATCHDLADHAAWVASREHSVRDVPGHDAARADDGTRADVDAGQDERSASHPDVRANRHRLSVLLPPALRCAERMQGRVDLRGGTEQRVVADPDAADVQHDAVEVEEDPLAQLDVRAIVAEKRWL